MPKPKPAWLLNRAASPRSSARRASMDRVVRSGSAASASPCARTGREKAARSKKTIHVTRTQKEYSSTGSSTSGIQDFLDQRVIFEPGRRRRLREIVLLGQRGIGVGLEHHQLARGGQPEIYAPEAPDLEHPVDAARDPRQLHGGAFR